MFRTLALSSCLLVCCSLFAVGGGIIDPIIIKRGDSNNDSTVNMSDATSLAGYLYNGGPAPPCLNQSDANADGRLDGADVSFILNWLYNGGSAPPAPGPYNTICTNTPSPPLGCDSHPCG